MNLDGETVQCCEALLRWNHPEQGLIMPADFIPIAEEIGLIVPIGEWVIRRACQDATAWPDDIRVAVNLSPTQLNNSLLFPTVLNALNAAQLPAHRLELEITEAVLMENTEANLRTLHGLRSLGIRISMDDFGTGYSSLSYLRSFPFDKIKIDRCFITGLGDDDEFGRDRAGGRRARAAAQHDDDGGRGRDAHPARPGPRARLHRRPGPLLQPAGPGKRARRILCKAIRRRQRRRVKAIAADRIRQAPRFVTRERVRNAAYHRTPRRVTSATT